MLTAYGYSDGTKKIRMERDVTWKVFLDAFWNLLWLTTLLAEFLNIWNPEWRDKRNFASVCQTVMKFKVCKLQCTVIERLQWNIQVGRYLKTLADKRVSRLRNMLLKIWWKTIFTKVMMINYKEFKRVSVPHFISTFFTISIHLVIFKFRITLLFRVLSHVVNAPM